MAQDTNRNPTATMQNYLKAVYLLQQGDQVVATSQIAARLGGLSPGAVVGMIRRLVALGLATHTPYHGVRLTPAGTRAAVDVIRRHRLLELFLVEKLGYGWEQVHHEAEALEHVVGNEVIARIADMLGHPQYDPHGDPIPGSDGVVPPVAGQCLNDVPVRSVARVVRVAEQRADRLRYLADIGVVPGAIVRVCGKAPFDGPISVEVTDRVQPLGGQLAHSIFVELTG